MQCWCCPKSRLVSSLAPHLEVASSGESIRICRCDGGGCCLLNLLLQHTDFAHLLVQLNAHILDQLPIARVLCLQALILPLKLILFVFSLAAAILRVAPILECSPALLQLRYSSPREALNDLVQLAHRIAGQLFVGQLHRAAALDIGHYYVGVCVLNICILVGGSLFDGPIVALCPFQGRRASTVARAAADRAAPAHLVAFGGGL